MVFVSLEYMRATTEYINQTRRSFCNYLIANRPVVSYHKYFPDCLEMIRSKIERCLNFPGLEKQPQNFRHQMGDIKQVPY
jgi:hypothetical protein